MNKELSVKISDFGLSKDVGEMDYYRSSKEAALPVRWMAPECLMDGRFDSKGMFYCKCRRCACCALWLLADSSVVDCRRHLVVWCDDVGDLQLWADAVCRDGERRGT